VLYPVITSLSVSGYISYESNHNDPKTNSLSGHIMSAKMTTLKLFGRDDFSPHKSLRTEVFTTCLITAIWRDVISFRSPAWAFALQKKAIAKAGSIVATPRDIAP